MSRPSQSVPKGFESEGAWFLAARSVANRESGNNVPAATIARSASAASVAVRNACWRPLNARRALGMSVARGRA